MAIDAKIFMAGIAVGRQMKGWATNEWTAPVPPGPTPPGPEIIASLAFIDFFCAQNMLKLTVTAPGEEGFSILTMPCVEMFTALNVSEV